MWQRAAETSSGHRLLEIERSQTRKHACADEKMACCPPEALPYLVAEPATTGKKESVEGVEFYVSGPSGASAAILLFPDVWGWDSGRTRALADAFAEEGYRVYVPKLLQPPLEGGTDGDGLPPTFDLQARGADFLPWIKTVTWEATKPKVEALLAHAKADGASTVGVVGCCWGGWACFQTSALTADVKCGVIFHPSCQIEGAHGGDVQKLCKRVQAPMCFMPAAGDAPELYGEEGSLVVGCPAGSKTKLFADMAHGWVPRGDVANADVKRDVALAMSEAIAYFADKLPLSQGGCMGCL
mmetsp:Transcript_26674/g.82044  ORF Transcript_26674/g.82044 Transcript_26674/m.82044 type:complete len:298 (+) Transcript_26674:1041-1934(+)